MQSNSFFRPLSFNLQIKAVSNGLIKGSFHYGESGAAVYCDGRYYIAGNDPTFEAACCADVFDQVGGDLYVIYGEDDLLQRLAQGPLAERHPMRDLRCYYEVDTNDAPQSIPVPAGYELVSMDAKLLKRQEVAGLAGLDDFLGEMVFEQMSLEDFLVHSFGLALLHDDTLVGWCHSMYEIPTRCEVGIGVAEGASL